MKIFSGSSNKPLAEKVARSLGLELSPLELFVFPDGERRVKLDARVVDEDTIVVQSTATPVDQNYVELFFIIDALKRSGAKSVTAVIPYLGYQRQDHVFREGETVSLDVMVKFLESLKVDKVIVLDLHSVKIPEMFSIPMMHLSALPLFANVIASRAKQSPSEFRSSGGLPRRSAPRNDGEWDGVLISPDMGGLRRIKKMSELLGGMHWMATVKNRNLDTGEISINSLEGDVSKINKKVFMIDDMISSGRTMIQSAALLKKHGVEEFYVYVTHPILSEEAPRLLQESYIDKVYVTDSVYIPKEKQFPKLEIVSIAEMIAGELR